MRYRSPDDFLDGFYLDLSVVKEVKCTGYPGDYPYHEGVKQFDIDWHKPVVKFITLVHQSDRLDPSNIRETR